MLTRLIVLNAFIKHQALTIEDIAKEENLGMVPNKLHLQFLLDELKKSGDLDILDGVTPCTYSITDKGIKEGARQKEAFTASF